MSRKDTVEALFKGRLGAPNAPSPVERTERVRTGAISAMGASLAQLSENAKTVARLQDQISSGDRVLELDPVDVDASLVSDRLMIEVDPTFEALVVSMAESGQQVPILVRPHPTEAGRYQAAYGHRRLRAASRLKIKVQAVVRPLSDAELVVAQGKENLERRDLSFIERAWFARRLEDRGFDRSVVIAALSCDKADVSRYVSMARAIPEVIAISIGPAPKAGRARWAELAEKLQQAGAVAIAEALVRQTEFLSLDSDLRFTRLLEVLRPAVEHKKTQETWVAKDGRKVARVQRGTERVVLAFDEKVAPAFGDYVLGQLDALLAAYESSMVGRRDGSS
ncbi:MAG: plasmid partitioning protein RepB [Hyphomicrobiales bacterium]|nr:MAG: plasmid partitioning protein RepB [Hyphomicrobiales bacterium]